MLQTQAATPRDSSFADTLKTKEVQAESFSPFGTSRLSNFFSNVSVSSFFKEGVNGKIELQAKFASKWSAGLSVDQKIGKNDKTATPLSLSGISPGTTVEFNLQKVMWKPDFNLSREQILSLMQVSEAYAKRNSDSSKGTIIDPRSLGLREIYLNGTQEEKRTALAAFSSRTSKQPVLINVRGGFTKTSFSYSTDSVMLTKVANAFITPTFTVSLVKALGRAFDVTGYVALSYNYSETYNAGDDISFSVPFGTTRNFFNSTLAFGKPTKETTNNLTLELRQNVFKKTSEESYMNIAISPSATLDIDRKRLGVFLPIYLIKGSDDKGKEVKGLQGGVRLGYITSTESGKISSFKNGFIAQLIISQPLDFLDKF